MDYQQHKQQNLIRLHPEGGGITIPYGTNQRFEHVSSDLYIGLNKLDFINPYLVTRKLNLSIAVNPCKWSTQSFFTYFTEGPTPHENPFTSKALAPTDKCPIHGDKDTGLRASINLMRLLKPTDLKKIDSSVLTIEINGVRYIYDSVGVASNYNYAPVSQRQDNPVANHSSHFEIKFRCQSPSIAAEELLCLNIHLMADHRNNFGKNEVCMRLEQAIRLFYSELGLLHSKLSYTPKTNLEAILDATIENYEDYNLSCKHKASLAVLNKRKEVLAYSASKNASKTVSLFDLIVKKENTPETIATTPVISKKPVSSWAHIACTNAPSAAAINTVNNFFHVDSKQDFPALGASNSQTAKRFK